MYQPIASVASGKDYRVVTVKMSIDYSTNGKYAVHIVSGDLIAQSKGLLSARQHFEVGDVFTAQLQLSPINGFTRYAFKARLMQLLTAVHHSENWLFLNNLRKYAASFRGDDSNLVAGLAIGIDDGLSQQFLANMKITGLTHLTAVSGANCAIVLGAFWLVGRGFRIGRNQRFILMVLALAGYVSLVGPQPSVLRAAFMMTTVAFALEFGRRIWIPAAVAVGSMVLLITDPWLIVDYGFWLSVLATLGLVLITPKLHRFFRERMPEAIALGLAATVAAQLWCLPLLIQLQGGLTTYSVLANLLVEPVVPAITLLGLVATLVGVWLPFLGNFLFQLASIPAHWIVFVSNSLANAPLETLSMGATATNVLLVTLFVAGLSIAIMARNFVSTAFTIVLLSIWAGAQISIGLQSASWPLKNWSVVNCDVGQGDALVIKSQDKVAVVDVGKDPKLIDQCLDRLKISNVSLLVLTHFDMDHVGGLVGLERGRVVDTVLLSPFPDTRPEVQNLVRDLRDNARLVEYGQLGKSGELGKFHWQVFSSLGDSATNANEGSLGIKFEDDLEVIYTLADLNEKAQSSAIGYVGDSPKVTIVKVSHHGSRDQSSEFYEKISADLAIISVGKENAYGHPTTRLLDILGVTKTRVFRTDQQGSISLSVDSSGIQARVSSAG